MNKNQNGFTLAELAIVLLCLGILAAIAVPGWTSAGLPVYRLNIAARQVVSDIRYARMRAVATYRQYRLRFDPVTDSYCLERGDLSSGSLSWSGEGLPRRLGPGSGGTFSGVRIIGEGELSVVFHPTGGVTAATVTLKNSLDRTMKVVCSMAGRVRMIRE
jgi:prepilin-type N-terminal cleavage/methylation domain-containing protein